MVCVQPWTIIPSTAEWGCLRTVDDCSHLNSSGGIDVQTAMQNKRWHFEWARSFHTAHARANTWMGYSSRLGSKRIQKLSQITNYTILSYTLYKDKMIGGDVIGKYSMIVWCDSITIQGQHSPKGFFFNSFVRGYAITSWVHFVSYRLPTPGR